MNLKWVITWKVFNFQCNFLLLIDVKEWINKVHAECMFPHQNILQLVYSFTSVKRGKLDWKLQEKLQKKWQLTGSDATQKYWKSGN
jgi:hypothetical protein